MKIELDDIETRTEDRFVLDPVRHQEDTAIVHVHAIDTVAPVLVLRRHHHPVDVVLVPDHIVLLDVLIKAAKREGGHVPQCVVKMVAQGILHVA